MFKNVQERLSVCPKTWPGTKEFDFTRIFKCGSCGSGITTSEKFKRSRIATHRYVYYHCTKFKDFGCKEPYIREEALIEQLEELIDQLPIEKIEADEKIKCEISRFVGFTESVLAQYQQTKIEIPENLKDIDAKKSAKYVIRHGTREEKRGLLACLDTNIYLKDRKIYIKKERN